VHVTGGMTALIATSILGPRKGRFHHAKTGLKLSEPNPMHGHSKSLQMLGTFILWFGWFGFNAGSAINVLTELRPWLMANATVNTTLSAAAAGVTTLVTNLIITERRTGEPIYNMTYTMNGCISGLVAITGGAAVVKPWAAIIIGVVAGWLYLFSSNLLVRWCIDDAVDSIPIHLSNGIWGTIATSLFASSDGLKRLLNIPDPLHVGWFYSWGRGSGDATLLGIHVLGLIIIIVWVVVLMMPFFFGLSYFGLLRSDALEEMVGLDVTYSGSGINGQWAGRDYDVNPEDTNAYNDWKEKRKSNSGDDNFDNEERTDLQDLHGDLRGVDNFN